MTKAREMYDEIKKDVTEVYRKTPDHLNGILVPFHIWDDIMHNITWLAKKAIDGEKYFDDWLSSVRQGEQNTINFINRLCTGEIELNVDKIREEKKNDQNR